MTLYADVVPPLPIDRPYTYTVPPEYRDRIQVGSRVLVPLGQRLITGFVVGLRKRKPDAALELKSIAGVFETAPLISPAILSYAAKLSRAFFLPWGEILQAAVPPSLLPRTRAIVSLTPKGKEALEKSTLSDEERAVADQLVNRAHSPLFLKRKLRTKGVSALLDRMERKELVRIERELKRTSRKTNEAPPVGPTQLELDFSLDENLRLASGTIIEVLAKREFSPFLIVGSPGRREAVYLHLIRQTISRSGRALVLVPEISRMPALIEKCKSQLGDILAVLHSGLTDRQRELEWQKMIESRAGVAIGTRSVLFAPLPELRLVILDEEHDESYSQQEGLPFDVRKAARIRAEEEKAVFVQGSAAPTVESYHSARKGGFLIDLGRETHPARVRLLDFRCARELVDPRLKKAMEEQLRKGEPAILLYNRRGYASSLVCPRCAHVPRCDRCDLSLAYHKREGKFICHACRRTVAAVLTCPRCGSHLTVRPTAGIEAVAEELKVAFPRSRVEIFAADEATRKEKKEAILKGFERKEIDILVGTRALSHQYGLPPVGLVGILHPEMVLQLADFRSAHKAYLLVRSAFRFLREGKASELYIQTSDPDHHSIREAARGDYTGFFEKEIRYRRLLDYPPFSFLAEVFFSAEKARSAASAARRFVARVRALAKSIQVYGPSLASPARKRGLFRVQVNLKARRAGILNGVLRRSLEGIRSGKSVFLYP